MDKIDVTSIEYLRDTFKIGSEAFQSSKDEANEIRDLFHNRQYTRGQQNLLESRGQPKETFNVIKLFTRMLTGYYSTVVNNIQVEPVGVEDVLTAAVLNDVISHILRDNSFTSEGERVKLSGILSGLLCVFVDVVETGEVDEFNRKLRKITIEHVPDTELVLDPMSHKDDYSDARFIHRFKWVPELQVVRLFGQTVADELEAYINTTTTGDADYSAKGKDVELGEYRQHDNFLIIHSVVEDAEGKTWAIFWHDNKILTKKEITHKEVRSPYRLTKVHSSESSERPEYYGVFREIVESQKAINQALIKFQLLVNTSKAYVQDGGVENIEDFTNAYNRVSAVIPVKNLAGIKIVDLAKEALDQYVVIDKAFDRIQQVLGINDSFLGMAFASDSGRKVKLQQNATIMSLRYLTGRIETFYRFLGWDIARLVKQYYVSHQVLRVVDEATGTRWIELNRPMKSFTGNVDPQTGQPVMATEFEEVLSPETGEPEIDEDGNYLIAPIPEPGTELTYTKIDIEIKSNAFNDEDEKSQLMLEQVLAGNVGQLLAQVNPAGFFTAAALSVQTTKTRHSHEIAAILKQTAGMLQPQEASAMAQQMPGQLAQQGAPTGGASSRTLNLPQNTNEQ